MEGSEKLKTARGQETRGLDEVVGVGREKLEAAHGFGWEGRG